MTHITDSELQVQVKEAFDAIRVPEHLNKRTLAAIEAMRTSTEDTPGALSTEVCGLTRSDGSNAATPAEVISFQEARPRKSMRRWLWAIAACVLVGCIGILGFWWATMPTAYVTIDVNPSIELGVSRFDYVVSERALNSDATPILEEVSVVGLPFGEALERLTASTAFAPYVTSKNTIAVNIVTGSAEQGSTLEETGTRCLDTLAAHGSCHVVDEATWEAAHHAGMGIARYEAAQELMALDPSLTLEDCASMPMRELRERIVALGGTVPSGLGEDGEGDEHHAEGSAAGADADQYSDQTKGVGTGETDHHGHEVGHHAE